MFFCHAKPVASGTDSCGAMGCLYSYSAFGSRVVAVCLTEVRRACNELASIYLGLNGMTCYKNAFPLFADYQSAGFLTTTFGSRCTGDKSGLC